MSVMKTLNAILDQLLATARAYPPAEDMPYRFEKRVMARLTAPMLPDAWTLWGRGLWRAAVSCVAIMVMSGAWAAWSNRTGFTAGDFSEQFETAVLAQADLIDDAE